MKLALKFGFSLMVVLAGVNLLSAHKAYAILPDNVPVPWISPAAIKTSFLNCDTGPFAAAQNS